MKTRDVKDSVFEHVRTTKKAQETCGKQQDQLMVRLGEGRGGCKDRGVEFFCGNICLW